MRACMVFISLLLVLPALLMPGALAQDVSVLPPSSSIDSGSSVNVTLYVNGMDGLYGYEGKVSFTPSLLSVSGVFKGGFLGENGSASTYFDWGETSGTIQLYSTRLSAKGGVNGSGPLAVITFRGEAGGSSAVDLHDFVLSNVTPEQIPAALNDGSIAVAGEPPPDDEGTGPGGPGGPPGTPGTECYAGQTTGCGPDAEIGLCRLGTRSCQDGAWGICTGAVFPTDEICDGLDNDCDGFADEGLDCDCFIGETRQCGLETGVCEPGYRMCVNGEWADECTDEIGPTEELCGNGLDDDCDGETDEERCIMAAAVNCTDGPIESSCLCAGVTRVSGYCYGDVYHETNPYPDFPWEVVSLIGGVILTATLLVIGVKEMKHFGVIGKSVTPADRKLAVRAKPAPKARAKAVTKAGEIVSNPAGFIGKPVSVSGQLKVSKQVSAGDLWYSFYDDTGVLAVHSGRELKPGPAELRVTIRKTSLGYVYGDVV